MWPVMMDDNAPTHKGRKLVKTYKNVLPRKRIVVAKVCGETYSKNDKMRWSRKTATNVTRSIRRTQTPPRLWPLTLSCDFDLKSRSKRLMSLDVAYCIVPWCKYDVCECNSLWDMSIISFLWPLTFTCDLELMSRSLSLQSVDVPY